MSEQDRADLLASRKDALLANAHGIETLFALMPEYATEQSWAAYVEAMAQPQVDDGATEAESATGAAWAVAAALGKVPRAGQGSPLAEATPAELEELARAARPVLTAIASNPLLRASWHRHADEWARHLLALRDVLPG
jgi:hypothetical protein